MVGLMMGDAGTVMEGTVREGIIRPMGTRGVVAIVPAENEKEKQRHDSFYCFPLTHFVWLI